ncbi:tRNA wybutosine-synthesizing protein 3 homolog isoform X2 [Sphaerodactylus townsendi]|uniref:tRNA wybutosine-synthesizing protein 3 homolog isoform X2 n=1 Tax=Sphaerodactylus townsendi TaxID=933632 RepID=UPI00202622E3|nr:tRNA wybutosine-synthesizing protein 3 homolog isoform X2 [Sphaerodactylus townsendi]
MGDVTQSPQPSSMADFKSWKEQRLSRVDGSRKGSVDEPIAGIVQLLNDQDCFCTTSSCSGRVVVLEQPPLCSPTELTALQKATNDAIFKFEPFVLHVQCRELQDAQLLHTVAIEAGFRNSGITVGRKGKIMMAVRSTHCLEVPLSQKGKLMVSEEYVDFVVHVANQKMKENRRRIDRFYSCLQFALENKDHKSSLPAKEREQNSKEQNNTVEIYRSRRKSKGTQKDTSAWKNKGLENEDNTENNLNIFH